MAERHLVAIALGSNQGDPCDFIRIAAEKLFSKGVHDGVRSSLYRTSPVDCPDSAPDFVNAALIGKTELDPQQLLTVCREIEVEMGRPATRGYHEDRVIDLDLLMYDDLQLATESLTLPHPEMTARRFVLEPLAEIAPTWIVPGTRVPVRMLLEHIMEGEERVECIGN